MSEPIVGMEVIDQPDPEFAYAVNEYLEANTKYRWADEFLKKRKPLAMPWFCFWIMAFAFSMNNIEHGFYPERIIPGLLFGYAVAYIVGRFIYFRQHRKFCTGSLPGHTDIMELSQFLTDNLRYLKSNFGEWSLRGQNSDGKEYIAYTFSKSVEVRITFYAHTPDETHYTISVTPSTGCGTAIRLLTMADFSLGRLFCICKTAPILAAAMQYYAKKAAQ